MQDTTVDVGGFKPTQTISISMGDVTKTALGEKDELSGKYPLYWSAGDQVSINGVASNALAEDFVQNKVAQFEFSGDLGSTPYKVSYPATETPGNVVFAAVQTHTEGTFSAGAAPMYGESNSLQIEMQHLVGVLKLPIVGAEGITLKSVSIVGADAETRLAGAYTVELVEGVAQVTPTTDATNRITYDCAGLALSDTPQVLHIAVPEGVYETLALIITATDAEGKTLAMRTKVQAPEAKPIKPGVVREFSTITFADNDPTFLIEDSESLIEFKTLCENGNFVYTGARVTKDFTFEGEWSPVSGFVNDLEFDGGDFTITGLTDALFDKANGFIHNLTLKSTIEKEGTGASAIFANKFAGSISDCTAKGSLKITKSTTNWAGYAGVVGLATGSASFVNVTNEASVTIDNSTNRTYIAGILASNYPGAELPAGSTLIFTNCHNTGALTSESNGSNRRGIGGILGCHYTPATSNLLTITSCTNTGTILAKNPCSDAHFGGIGGSIMGVTEIISSSNNAPINLEGEQTATGNNYSLAGIVGYQTGKITMTGCTNLANGLINISNAPGGVKVGGLIGYLSYEGTGNIFNNCSNKAAISLTGSYKNLYFGGCIGHARSNVSPANDYTTACSNDANITYTGSTTAGVYAGGTVGYAEKPISKCVNNGKVTFGGTSTSGYFVGGVIGYSTNEISYLTSSEDSSITYNGTAGTNLYAGGMIGYTTKSVSNCTNNGEVNIGGSATTNSFAGGVIGIASGGSITLDTIVNNGNFTASNNTGTGTGATSTDAQYEDANAGGIVGRLVGTSSARATATGLVNNATVTFQQTGILNAKNSNSKNYGYSSHGGIIGGTGYVDMSGCYNSDKANIIFDNNYGPIKNHDQGMMWGGIVGGTSSTKIDNCDNSATIYVKAAHAATTTSDQRHHLIGGIVGRALGATVKDCDNNGDIMVENTFKPKRCNIGGVVGYGYTATVTTCSFSKKLDYKAAPTTNQMYFGGVMGCVYNKYGSGVTITGSTFSGEIAIGAGTVTSGSTLYVCIGGIGGYMDNTGAQPITLSGCTVDNGKITIDPGFGAADTNVYVGGIIGVRKKPVSDCIVNCTINAASYTKVGIGSGTAYNASYLITGCQFDGSISSGGHNVDDIHAANFFNYVYPSGAPENWATQENPYDGNYGIEFGGGDGID